MCGIYGEFFSTAEITRKEKFLKENDKNSKRGPDNTGYFSNEKNCQFGFRRLSILDLSEEGNQPMISADGNFVIVFNGEIYNFKKLRKILQNLCFHFKTETDTEVLVNYIQQFGLDKTLADIDGMFAFAVYSKKSDSIDLVRDFAGIKPLFYSFIDGNLVFGSQYNLIRDHSLNKDSKIDKEVLRLYLKMHYIPAPYGILENTFQVQPGQRVSIDSKGHFIKQFYWVFPELDEANLITDKSEALRILEKSLSDSVKDQLVSDVPVGTFLSGGIDSPLINYFANEIKPGIKAFSIGSDSSIHDESKDATKYAELIGCDFKLKNMDAEIAKKILKSSVHNLYEPFGDYSILPTYQLCKISNEYCTVMLSGDGGDELFFGYERFQSLLKNKRWLFIPKSLRYLFYGIDKVLFKNKHVNEAFLEQNLALAHQGQHSLVRDTLIDELFPNLKGVDLPQLEMYGYNHDLSDLQILHEMRRAEFYGMMQKTLVKVDRMSMANSVEVRVPFLKKSFIEASLKIHPSLSFGKDLKKDILKSLLRKLLPNSPINNIKRGFSIPLSKWLREDLKESFEDVLFDQYFLDLLNIKKNRLQKIWDEHQIGKVDHKRFLFSLYTLATWLKVTE